VCVSDGMITLSGRGRQQCLFNSVIDSPGIESGKGDKTLWRESGKRSVAGKLQISTTLSGPWQNANYTHTHTHQKLTGAPHYQHSEMEVPWVH